jgi:hypothetical protein
MIPSQGNCHKRASGTYGSAIMIRIALAWQIALLRMRHMAF